MTEFRWTWAGERAFRARMVELRKAAASEHFEKIGRGRFEAAAGPTILSPGYVAVIHAAAYSAKPDLRAQFTDTALVVLDGELCRRLVWPFVGTQIWFPLIIDQAVLEWTVHNGTLEYVPSVFVADHEGILVALEKELPLPADFWVERQLLRAELAFRTSR